MGSSDGTGDDPFAVAVVVPTYGRAPYLVDTLLSLEHQTLRPKEVVVVDDGSVPPVIVPTTALGTRVIRIRHGGIAAARNAGVSATTSPLIHICDHDDLVEPEFLERLSTVFADDGTVDVAHSACGFIDADGAVQPGHLPYLPPPVGDGHTVLAKLLQENHIASVATVFRREALLHVGGFRPLDYVQDWDLWLRLAAGRSRFAHVPEVLAWHRVHAAQQSREAHRVRILEESLGMIGELRLPPNLIGVRRRSEGLLHLQAARVLHSRGERGGLRHLVVAAQRRPFDTIRAAGRALR